MLTPSPRWPVTDWGKQPPPTSYAIQLRPLSAHLTIQKALGGLTFWVNAIEILEKQTKRTLWLQMPEATRLPWMTKQVDKMN